MFSVTNTGLKTLPLCTVKVSPTKSGVIIDRRDQVLIGVLDFVSLAFWILSSRWKSTNGPFLIERPIVQSLAEFHRATVAAHQDKAVRVLLAQAGLATLGNLAPRRHELLPTATGLRLTGATTV